MQGNETTHSNTEPQVGYVSTPMWVREYYWRRRLVEAMDKTKVKSCDIGSNTHAATHPGTPPQTSTEKALGRE